MYPAPASGRTIKQWYQRKWLWIPVLLVFAYLLWLVHGPITWRSTTVARCPGGIEVRSISLHHLAPSARFWGVLLPLPSHTVQEDYELVVRVNGREFTRTGIGAARVHPSPDGAFIVLDHSRQNRPIEVITSVSGNCSSLIVANPELEFPVAEIPGTSMSQGPRLPLLRGYPFRFQRWDSNTSFLVLVPPGADYGLDSAQIQVWKVDARSLARSRLE